MSPSHDDWIHEPTDRHRVTVIALVTGIALTLGGATVAFFALVDRDEQPEALAAEAPPVDAVAVAEPAADTASEEPADEPAHAAVLAQEEVERLQGELDQALTRIEEFEAKEARASERSAAARERWAAMEAEVARLQVALAEAEAERDQLRTELASTLQQLDQQIARTREVTRERDTWKRASNENLWTAFVQSAKVRLCDRGNRRSMDRCQETLAQVFDDAARSRFDHCVSAGQAVPTIVELDRRAEPPNFSEPLPADVRQIDKGTYVVYCDPTLPEATSVAEGPAPEPTVMRLAAR